MGFLTCVWTRDRILLAFNTSGPKKGVIIVLLRTESHSAPAFYTVLMQPAVGVLPSLLTIELSCPRKNEHGTGMAISGIVVVTVWLWVMVWVSIWKQFQELGYGARVVAVIV
jgi:hypothetical protein